MKSFCLIEYVTLHDLINPACKKYMYICIYNKQKSFEQEYMETIDDGMTFGYGDIDKEYIKIAASRENLLESLIYLNTCLTFYGFLKLSYCKLLEPIVCSW